MNKEQEHIFTAEQVAKLMKISKIGGWVWFLDTGIMKYNKEWADLVEYELDEIEETADGWRKVVLQEDLRLVNSAIEKYLNAEVAFYEAEYRIVKKDGTIMWVHDKGSITEYAADGTPLIFCGITQDITPIKLRDDKERLQMVVEIAEFGTWDWDIKKDVATYSSEYLKMLGYAKDGMCGTLSEWQRRIHPDDIVSAGEMLTDYVEGRKGKYECELRLHHKDGHYIWTRDTGRIVSRDIEGHPTRMIGCHFNIDRQKCVQNNLKDALSKLERSQVHLEEQIELRTKKLVEQEKMLLVVAEISQELVALNGYENTDEIIYKCLKKIGQASHRNRVYIWRNIWIDEKLHCYPLYRSYSKGYGIEENTESIDDVDMLNYIDGEYSNEQKEDYFKNFCNNILPENYTCYETTFPTIYKVLAKEKTLNILAKNLPALEGFWANYKNIKVSLISPIYLDGGFWGFIGIDNCIEEKIFSEIEENMLSITGSLFANAIQKVETDELLRRAHEEALMSFKAKSNFLANMSHEIHTPMNVISGMAEIILRESEGRVVNQYASAIKNASGSLLTIINDIMDFSKIESGKLDISETEYDLSVLINDVISIARMRLLGNSLEFFTFIDSSLPAIIIGDAIRIKQVLVNLINNAIKFTSSGHVGINVYGKYGRGKVYLTFEVYDSGIGIKSEDMDILFEESESVNTIKSRSKEGTGLGLSITKRLAEMMNGSISAKSVVGEGSTFTINIIQKYKDYSPIAFVSEKKSVLLYESREMFRDTIKNTVENLGATCTSCTNQSDFYEKLSAAKYDFVFTSTLHIGKVKALKEKQKLDSKIVLLTGISYSKEEKNINAVSFPINCIQIADILNNTISVSARGANTNLVYFEAPDAKVLIVDDTPINLLVAMGIMEPYRFAIDTAKNGLEAIQMVRDNVYDIIFMDHMMPEMDGVDTTMEIRSLKGDYYKNVPIIALTVNAIVGVRGLFIHKGMSDILTKPIEAEKLNEILFKWLPKHKIITK